MRTPARHAGYRSNLRGLAVAFGLALILVSGWISALRSFLSEDTEKVVSVQSESPAQETTLRPGETKTENPTTGEQDRQGKETVERLDTRKLYREVAGIAGSHDGEYGVAVFDPDSGKGVLYNGDEVYDAASIGKLPVLAALYREAASGKIKLDEDITIQTSDVQSYGSGVLHARPVGTKISLEECAYHLIKDSDNTAWTMLYRRLGLKRVSDELEPLGARDSRYDAYGRLYTNAGDTLEMLKKLNSPEYTNEELSSEMLSLMTETAYEDRLPEPLPKDGSVRVAHKVGSNASTFGDAGIVYYGDAGKTDRHYFIVVLAKDTTEPEARDAMHEMSRAAYRAIF